MDSQERRFATNELHLERHAVINGASYYDDIAAETLQEQI